MSDPASQAVPLAAPATLLTYDAARRYQGDSPLNLPGLLLVFLAGVGSAAVAAVIAWIWYQLRLPSLIVIPMVIQGVLVGSVIALLCRRVRVRNVPLVMSIGLMCGLLSALCHQGVVYLYGVYDLPKQVQVELWSQGIPENSPQARSILTWVRAHSFTAFDRTIIAPTGVKDRGFVGFLKIRETEVWVLVVLQALIVAGIAVAIGKMYVDHPYCNACGKWFNEPYTPISVPQAYGEPLARALEADDPRTVAAVIEPWKDQPGGHEIRTEVFHCPSCRRSLARVRGNRVRIKRDSTLGTLYFISSETLAALRNKPAVSVESNAIVES